MHELEKPEWIARRILRSYTVEKGFTFSYEFARPTDLTVHSLDEFFSALKAVDASSLEFHNERGDFERWIRHVIGDSTLADRLKETANQRLNGEILRKKTLNVVEQRIKELKTIAKGDR